MPGLAVPMNPIADATFVAQRKQLPVNWKQPQGDPATDHYRRAFKTEDHGGVPVPGCYFWAQSTNKFHVDSCKNIGDIIKSFCHDMLKGFKQSVDIWRAQARFQNLRIAAVSVTGARVWLRIRLASSASCSLLLVPRLKSRTSSSARGYSPSSSGPP